MPERQFFIGRAVDIESGKPTDQQVLYNPADLVTHGIITGMTGSGKTGLGVGFLEEAALSGIPAIVLDPKGDMTNLLLHFPELAPGDFEPWIDPEAARRVGKPLGQLAAETAASWRNGLGQWGLGRDQLIALRDSAGFTIYTPGSTAGVPVNVLASFSAPGLDWDEHREILRERISTIVTALLTLVGVAVTDPLRSREHILLSNVLEHAWSEQRSLDLHQLILETSTPPFDRLGAFPLDSVYPQKDRFELAMLLNNFLASPSFQTWIEGESLDIGALLYLPDGRPRHSVFYLAHLSEQERMFFVTLLFAAIEGWMRAQRGTGMLRLLVYFDEIMGYMPPIANPPSRPVLLRMLKQARAFGVGLLLATQNPVDVDYKALSNAGTWLIGRLQTEQDKNRLVDGLRSASGSIDINEVERIISGLPKRTFYLHSVHRSKPTLLSTRWVLNYLAGPVTRGQIPALNALAGAAPPAAAGSRTGAAAGPSAPGWAAPQQAAPSRPAEGDDRPELPGFAAQPPAVSGLEETFVPASIPVERAARASGMAGGWKAAGTLYRPALYALAEVRYLHRQMSLDYSRQVDALVLEGKPGRADWDASAGSVEQASLSTDGIPGARFEGLPSWLGDTKSVNALRKDFADWVYRAGTIRIRANQQLKVYAPPDVSEAEYARMCREAAQEGWARERDKIEDTYRRKLETLQQKVHRQELEVAESKADVDARRSDELTTGLAAVMGMLGGRRRNFSTNVTKRRMTAKAKSDLQQETADLQALQRDLERTQAELAEKLREVDERWGNTAERVSEVPLAPTRSNIYVERFALAWLPHHIVEGGGQYLVLPAYEVRAR